MVVTPQKKSDIIAIQVLYSNDEEIEYKTIANAIKGIKRRLEKGIKPEIVQIWLEWGYYINFDAIVTDNGIKLVNGIMGQVGTNASAYIKPHLITWSGQIIPL